MLNSMEKSQVGNCTYEPLYKQGEHAIPALIQVLHLEFSYLCNWKHCSNSGVRENKKLQNLWSWNKVCKIFHKIVFVVLNW